MKNPAELKASDIFRMLRKKLNMTQEELASELGVSNKTISAWEMGSRSIPAEKMNEIAEKSDTSITDLYREHKKKLTGATEYGYIYICKKCGNIIAAKFPVDIVCCGLKLKATSVNNLYDKDAFTAEISENRIKLTITHAMEKKHHLTHAFYISESSANLQNIENIEREQIFFPYQGPGIIGVVCSIHGLFAIKI